MPFGVKLMLRWKAACQFNIKGCFYEKTGQTSGGRGRSLAERHV